MGTDKAVLVVDGERLVDRAARRMAAVADPVFVAPGRRGRVGDLPWTEVDDLVADGGPLGGIGGALAESITPLVAVAAVDMVDLDAAMLAWLASLWDGEAVIVPRDEHGRLQPLHAVYAWRAAPAIGAALERRELSVHDVLDRLPVREVGPDEWGPRFAAGWSRNLNTPDDLQ